MFTVKIIRPKYKDELMFLASDVRYVLNELILDGSSVYLDSGDTAFIMNPAGATVSRYNYLTEIAE